MTPAQRRNRKRSALARLAQAHEALTALYEDDQAVVGLSLNADRWNEHAAISRTLDALDKARAQAEPLTVTA
jgi:hypothetical protein